MIKNILIIIFILLLGSYDNCFSQVNVEWFSTYSAGWGKNFVNDFVIDSSGNSYLTGNVARDAGNQITAFGTVKFSSNGELLWSHIYEGSEHGVAEGNALVVDKSGNVCVVGTCVDIDSSENYSIIKYNSSGEVLWIRKYHSSLGGRDFASDITIDNQNNVYVTGFTYYYGSPDNKFWSTLKYDSLGNLVWVKRYEGILNRGKQSRIIIVDENQNVYVSGTQYGDSNKNEFCTIKYDQEGHQQWLSIYHNSGLDDEPSELLLDKIGNVYILGQSFIPNYSFYTSLVKYNSNGDELWHVITDSTGNIDFSYYRKKISFKLDSENNIYIATTYRNFCSTLKYNSAGLLEWISKYNKNPDISFSNGLGINIDDYGYIYTTGLAFTGSVVPFLTIKHNPTGLIIWERSYHVFNYGEFDEGAYVGFDKNNNVYIGGNHNDDNNHIKYSLLKYSQGVGISNISTEIPSNYNLYQNYPNPFNPETNIRFDIPEACHVIVKVYNNLGKQVSVLVDNFKQRGSYIQNFNSSELSSGIYYYNLQAGNFSETKKMVVLK